MRIKDRLKVGSGKLEVKGAKAFITSNNGCLNNNFEFSTFDF
jgi:hypothetical protein